MNVFHSNYMKWVCIYLVVHRSVKKKANLLSLCLIPWCWTSLQLYWRELWKTQFLESCNKPGFHMWLAVKMCRHIQHSPGVCLCSPLSCWRCSRIVEQEQDQERKRRSRRRRKSSYFETLFLAVLGYGDLEVFWEIGKMRRLKPIFLWLSPLTSNRCWGLPLYRRLDQRTKERGGFCLGNIFVGL